MEDNEEKNKKKVIITILLIIIIILLYLLFHKFGNIEHHGLLIPTGNVDIFELECGCSCNCECDKPVFSEEDNNLTVFDKEKVWDNNFLRIFSNPAYEYQSKIAPGSENSYAFVIRNNNDFDVIVDITGEEVNPYNINMKYKLKHQGNYILGNGNNYVNAKDLKVTSVHIKAHDQKSYILDWKWVDSINDTEIGFDVNSNYKLKMSVKAVRA